MKIKNGYEKKKYERENRVYEQHLNTKKGEWRVRIQMLTEYILLITWKFGAFCDLRWYSLLSVL